MWFHVYRIRIPLFIRPKVLDQHMAEKKHRIFVSTPFARFGTTARFRILSLRLQIHVGTRLEKRKKGMYSMSRNFRFKKQKRLVNRRSIIYY